jgi:CRISPR-associated protein Csm5
MSKNTQYKSYTLSLTGLSPLFIGSGDTYSQLDYVYHNNKIHIIDFDKLLEQIPIEVIDDLTNEISENFKNNIWEGDIKNFLAKYHFNWQESVEKTYEIMSSIGRNEIQQFIKTGERIYIPGSSLKGAMRTALLFHILETHPQKKERLAGNINRYFKDRKVRELIQDDGSNDLLRALIVSDSHLSKDSPIKIVPSTVYHLQNRESTIPIYYEILDTDFISQGTLKINTKLITSNALKSDTFSLSKNTLIRAINSFSKTVIAYELNQFTSRKDSKLDPIIAFYTNLRDIVDNNLDEDECIIRLGQGSSILGITLFLNFRDNQEIINKYAGLEIFHFNVKDRNNPGFGISRTGGFTILPDRNSPNRPRLNEYWLCRVVATRKRTKFVILLERVESRPDDDESGILYPLTRKFIVSNDILKVPFGWVKLTWE